MQTNPQPHSKVEKQKQHFDALSDDYFSATQHPNCLAFNRLIWNIFLTRHASILPRGAQVLEPMCGHGIAKEHLENALHDQFTYSGFDYSQTLVDIAQARMPGARVFLQDVTRFEANQHYDMIFLSGGLHHVFDQTGDVLSRLYAALAPGGYMLSAEPTYDNPIYAWLGNMIYKHNKKFEHESEQRYALSALNAQYRSAGFTVIDQIYPGLLAYVIAVSAFCFPRFCIGSPAFIEKLVGIESRFYRSWLGRRLSFSTITLLHKPA